jgi:hypothetical protein
LLVVCGEKDGLNSRMKNTPHLADLFSGSVPGAILRAVRVLRLTDAADRGFYLKKADV